MSRTSRAHRLASTLRLPGLALACAALAACASGWDAYRQRHAPSLTAAAQPAQNDRGMYLQLIRQMQQQGAYYASLAHVEAFRRQYGDSPELRLLQADALRETGQDAAANALYEGLNGSPQAAAAWHGLGLIAVRAGDQARAERCLSTAARLDPVNAAYLSDLGYARLQAGDADGAREPLAKAAELAPGNAKAVSNLIVWQLQQGRSAQAEAMMQKADLPPATRAEIRRLAQTLRRPAIAATASGQVSSDTVSREPVPMGSGMPQAMLDRFGGNQATREVRP